MSHELKLYSFQEEGVQWMLNREQCAYHKAGLLLDGCGIGKTPQMCATLMRNPQPTTLLVLPVNLITQWKAALTQWAPHFRLAVFHGSNVPRWDRRSSVQSYFSFLAKHQHGGTTGPLVVLTSYGKVVDRPFEKRRKRLKKDGKLKNPRAVGTTMLHKMVWDRIVLDEAHVIRNKQTIRTRYILSLRGTIKWALTATPIHNGIQDYQCLLQFLGLSEMEILHLFASHPVLERYLNDEARMFVNGKTVFLEDTPHMGETTVRHEDITLRRTKKVLKRTRNDDDDEDPRVVQKPKTLPPLFVNIVLVEQSSIEEQRFYHNLEQATLLELLRFEAEDPQRGVPEVREQFMFELLLRLRQASVNPSLALAGYKRKFKGAFPLQLLHGCVPQEMLQTRAKQEMLAAETMFLERVGVPSKTRALLSMLRMHRYETAIVFCEFTEEMPILQADLESHGFSCALYNGSMTRNARDAVIQRLSWTHDVLHSVLEGGFFGARCHLPNEIVARVAHYLTLNVVLIQINSGNAGLNLQMCSRVYFTQPNWNPCIEEQAQSRAHRCGQDLDVHAVKLVGVRPNGMPTIDGRVLDVQVAKRRVMADILCDDDVLFNGDMTSANEYLQPRRSTSRLDADEMRKMILGE